MPKLLPRLSLTTTLVALFLPLVCATGLLVSALGVRRTEEVLSSASEQTLQAMVGELRAEIRRAIDPSKAVLELERIEELADDLNFEQRLDLLPSFAEALANTPAYAAYMVADRGGRLFLVARAKEPKGGLVVQGIDPGKRLGRRIVFDATLRQLSSEPFSPPPGFDLKERPWVRLALASKGPVLAPLHRFVFGGQVGVTLSLATADGGAVGAALPLSNLGELLSTYRITPGTQLAIVTPQGLVVATPAMEGMGNFHQEAAGGTAEIPTLAQLGMPALAALAPQLKQELRKPKPMDRPPGFSHFDAAGQGWRGAVVALPSPLKGGNTF